MQIYSGIDVVNLSRVELKDIAFAKRYMHKQEWIKLDNYHTLNAKIMYMGAIWAIKEAVLKATQKKYLFSEIQIDFSFNQPIKTNISNLSVSVSYENNHVYALAIYYI